MRTFPDMDERVETGPIRFGTDWPGLFIRGDNAIYYAVLLGNFLDGHDDPISALNLRGLQRLLTGCDERLILPDKTK